MIKVVRSEITHLGFREHERSRASTGQAVNRAELTRVLTAYLRITLVWGNG